MAKSESSTASGCGWHPEGMGTLVSMVVRSFFRSLPDSHAAQRQLLAVLSELNSH